MTTNQRSMITCILSAGHEGGCCVGTKIIDCSDEKVFAEIRALRERAEQAEKEREEARDLAEHRGDQIVRLWLELDAAIQRAEKSKRERDELRSERDAAVDAEAFVCAELTATRENYRNDVNHYLAKIERIESQRARVPEEVREAIRSVLRYVGKSGAHDDVCESADEIYAWLASLETETPAEQRDPER